MNIQAKLFARDAGRVMPVGRINFYSKMTAIDTQGAYTVVEALVPPDSGSGLHCHWSFDEAALIIDGKQMTLGPNESVYWPRGAIHKFKSLGPGDSRILFVCSPGRIFEEFIEQISSSHIQTGTANSGPAVDVRAIASKYGIEFVD